MDKVRVRFLVRAVYDRLGPGKGPVYEAGSVHELDAHEAERWFRRHMAEPAPVEAPPAPKPRARPVARETPAAVSPAETAPPGAEPPAA